jgi:thymidine phosphorylase
VLVGFRKPHNAYSCGYNSGLTIPKTSSRAITSPAGTADTLETMTAVNSIKQPKKSWKRKNGCFVWGGSIKLSPGNDILIRVEEPSDVDGEG